MNTTEAIDLITGLKEKAIDIFIRAAQLLEADLQEFEDTFLRKGEKPSVDEKDETEQLKNITKQLHHLQTNVNIHFHVTIDVLKSGNSGTASHTISSLWEAWGIEAFSTGGHIASKFLLNGIPAEGKTIGELVFMGGAISIAIREIIEKATK